MSESGAGGPSVISAKLFDFPGILKPRNNLPATTTRVVGRDAVIDQLLRQVAHAPLISIVGPGGIGKTTVALAVAERANEAFPNGVWFVDVAPLRDASLVPHAIAGATGLVVHSAHALTALCRSLRHCKALLVIDNCEHLAASVAACVDELLREAPDVRFVVTSRCPLQLNCEWEHRLEGLASPPRSTALTAALALTFPAVAMFVDRARDRRDSFVFEDADAPTVADICRSLDGIALAIELAAMRVDAFGVKGLLKQLNGRLSVLSGRRAGLERHRTLAATLDWSYGLLTLVESRMLRAVSVFSGGFRSQDASAVADTPVEIAALLLADLASMSLLSIDSDVNADAGTGEGVAYRLLETTRAYGVERLAEAGEERTIRLRHARYVCATLERAAADWGNQLSRDWGAMYGHYLDDLRSALAWTEAEPAHDDLVIRLTSAGTLLWNHFSLTDESRIRLTKGIARLSGLADGPGETASQVEMHLQFALAGAILYTRGVKPEARRAISRALEISGRLGDTDFRLRCLRLKATFELFFGESDAGLRTLETFLSIACAEDPSALAEGETHLGVGETFVGRLAGARQRMERLCAQSSQDFNDARFARFQYSNSVNMLVVLCHAQWLTGLADSAAQTADKILDYGRQSTHELSLSIGLAWNSLFYFWVGRDDECARHAAMLDDLVERHGIVTWRPLATFCRGAVAANRDTAGSEGINAMRQAVDECRQIGHMARLPFYIAVLAVALAKRACFREAEGAIHEAQSLAVVQNEQWCLPEIQRVHALIALAQGRKKDAEGLLLQAIDMSAAIGALSWELRAARDLAQLWQSQSRRVDAARMLKATLDRFSEGFGTLDLVAAADLLFELQAEIADGREGA